MVSLLLKLNLIKSLSNAKWLFCILIPQHNPIIKLLLFFNFVWCRLLKIVQNCSSSFLGRQWIGKNKSAYQIDWNYIIPSFKYGVLTTFLTITFQILILDNRHRYFWILQRLGCWKMYRDTFQEIFEAEKWVKQKWVLFFETPCSCS